MKMMKDDRFLGLLKLAIAEEMAQEAATIGNDDSFFDLGLDSMTCIFVMERIEKRTGLTLNPIAFWDYPTVSTFAAYLEGLDHQSG